ncbi:calcium/proton exchanger [Chloroflexota bacterium]
MKLLNFFIKKQINILLLAIPLAIIAEIFHWGEIWVFALSAAGVIPLASYIGEATEVLADYTGPRLGGLLNATLGNAAELIITIVAIREGLLELVKASITGSILGNILLVLGAAMLFGGLKNGEQSFNCHNASRNSILLVLAVVALLIPSMLSGAIGPDDSMEVEVFSIGVATIMIVLYGLGLYYSFKASDGPMSVHSSTYIEHHPQSEKIDPPLHKITEHTHWSVRTALIVLALSTAGVALLSELLVGAVEPVVTGLGVSEFFLGVILIPIIGNVAEHLVAVKVAIENQMDLSVEIAIASSLQIALFVAPILVFISLLFGNPLQLIYNQFELLALIVGVLIAALVASDGKSNWLEGAELLAVYIILSLAFFLLPV